MMLRHFARGFTRRMPAWDAPTRLAFVLALALLVLLLGLGFAGPPPIQLPARIGAFGLLVSLQLLFLWGNRRDISPYHQAQRHFIAGDYAAARAVLEALPDRGRESVDALTLLGNTYRHLGQFQRSQRALQSALELKPRHHLALFSMGKLQLVQGEYAAAAERITASLASGAPVIARFELGQCYFLLADAAAAREQLLAARESLDDMPAQAALLVVYLGRLASIEVTSTPLSSEHRRFWVDEARKYAESPYGAHLLDMVGSQYRVSNTR